MQLHITRHDNIAGGEPRYNSDEESNFPPSAEDLRNLLMSGNRGTLKSEDCFGGSEVHTICQSTLVTPSESSRSNCVARVTHISGLGILVNFR